MTEELSTAKPTLDENMYIVQFVSEPGGDNALTLHESSEELDGLKVTYTNLTRGGIFKFNRENYGDNKFALFATIYNEKLYVQYKKSAFYYAFHPQIGDVPEYYSIINGLLCDYHTGNPIQFWLITLKIQLIQA